MYKFSFPYHIYSVIRDYKFPKVTKWSKLSDETMRTICFKVANNILMDRRDDGAIIYLYRAAGLGVYNIALLMYNGGMNLDVNKIREYCHWMDKSLHGKREKYYH